MDYGAPAVGGSEGSAAERAEASAGHVSVGRNQFAREHQGTAPSRLFPDRQKADCKARRRAGLGVHRTTNCRTLE